MFYHMTLLHFQVIIFYQHKAVELFEEIWPKQSIYSFWPNTDNPETCITQLDTFFNAKDPHPDIKDFIVCQGNYLLEMWYVRYNLKNMENIVLLLIS